MKNPFKIVQVVTSLMVSTMLWSLGFSLLCMLAYNTVPAPANFLPPKGKAEKGSPEKKLQLIFIQNVCAAAPHDDSSDSASQDIRPFKGEAKESRTDIVAPIAGMFNKAELNPSLHYHAAARAEQESGPKQTAATGEKQALPAEAAVETEKTSPKTHTESDMPTLVEKTEEWDWSVCPSVYGCPCPMMP